LGDLGLELVADRFGGLGSPRAISGSGHRLLRCAFQLGDAIIRNRPHARLAGLDEASLELGHARLGGGGPGLDLTGSLACLLRDPFSGGEPLRGLAVAGSRRARLGFLDARGRHLQLLRELHNVPAGLILLLPDPRPELLKLGLERLADLDLALSLLLRSLDLLLGGSPAGSCRRLTLPEGPPLRFGLRSRLFSEPGRRSGRGSRSSMRTGASPLDGEPLREQQERDEQEHSSRSRQSELDRVPRLLRRCVQRLIGLLDGHRATWLAPGALEPHVRVEELDRRRSRTDRHAVHPGDARRRAAGGAPDRIRVAGLGPRIISRVGREQQRSVLREDPNADDHPSREHTVPELVPQLGRGRLGQRFREVRPADDRCDRLPNEGRRLALLGVHLRRQGGLLHERRPGDEETTRHDQHREERPLGAFAVVLSDDHPRPTRRRRHPRAPSLLCASAHAGTT
jgi:hypothetical protein